MKKNKIKWITFERTHDLKTDDSIVLSLKGKIPALGYGSKEIRKMLKKYERLKTI